MFIKKKEIISLIQGTKTFKNPKIALEQYTIDAESATNIVYHAGVENDDIQNTVVFDLGAGTMDVSLLDVGDGVTEVFSTTGEMYGRERLEEFLADGGRDEARVFLRNLRNDVETFSQGASDTPFDDLTAVVIDFEGVDNE